MLLQEKTRQPCSSGSWRELPLLRELHYEPGVRPSAAGTGILKYTLLRMIIYQFERFGWTKKITRDHRGSERAPRCRWAPWRTTRCSPPCCPCSSRSPRTRTSPRPGSAFPGGGSSAGSLQILKRPVLRFRSRPSGPLEISAKSRPAIKINSTLFRNVAHKEKPVQR